MVAASTVYLALVAVSGLATLVVWASVSVCHLRFRHQWVAQGHTVGELKYRAPGYPFVPVAAIVMCVGALVLVICDPSQRSTLLTMIPFVALCYAGYYASVAWRKKRDAADSSTGVAPAGAGSDNGPGTGPDNAGRQR